MDVMVGGFGGVTTGSGDALALVPGSVFDVSNFVLDVLTRSTGVVLPILSFTLRFVCFHRQTQ